MEEYIKNVKKYGIEHNIPIIKDKSLNRVKNILNNNFKNKLNNAIENNVEKLEYNILEIGTAIGYSTSVFILNIYKQLNKNIHKYEYENKNENNKNNEKQNKNIKEFYLNVYTIEKNETNYKVAESNLNILKHKLNSDANINNNLNNNNLNNNNFNFNINIKLIKGDAEKILINKFKKYNNINKVKENILFDFIFIDANKSKYPKYYKYSIHNLVKEGAIVCDNVLFNGWVLGEYKEKKHRTIVNNLRKLLKQLEKDAKLNKIEYHIYKEDDGVLEIHLI